MKTIKQPQIVQKELNKINKYYDEVEKFGYRPWNTVRQSHTYGQGQEIFHLRRVVHIIYTVVVSVYLSLR